MSSPNPPSGGQVCLEVGIKPLSGKTDRGNPGLYSTEYPLSGQTNTLSSHQLVKQIKLSFNIKVHQKGNPGKTTDCPLYLGLQMASGPDNQKTLS